VYIADLFGTEFFIAFGIGVLISGSATALYYSKEHIKRALRISD
jgi:glycerol uptake facilitator-like aquaporin